MGKLWPRGGKELCTKTLSSHRLNGRKRVRDLSPSLFLSIGHLLGFGGICDRRELWKGGKKELWGSERRG